MEQLQNIDLVLNIIVKVIFILLGLILFIFFYRVNKTLQYIKSKGDQITLNIQSTSEHIKNELTVNNFFDKFRGVVETVLKVYILDNARTKILSLVKKFL